MVQAAPFVLVLLVALGAHSFPRKCFLIGSWENDLGSNMTIRTMNINGAFTGTYYTAVSAAKKEILPSPLMGFQHIPIHLSSQPTFGFTVNWNFSDSTTVFTGQCFIDEDGKEVLKTMWLLRSRVDEYGDDWKATLVGYNKFKRLRKHIE